MATSGPSSTWKPAPSSILEPSKVDFVIYHGGCSDGFGAAYAAWKVLGDKPTYHPGFHGSPPPDVTGKHVAVFDFSYSPEGVKKLKEQAASFVLLDHHVSAEKSLANESACYFDMGKSGARLAWEYFHPDSEVPNMIAYIEDRDIWKWELPRSKEFTAAWDLVPQTFADYDAYLDNSTTAGVQEKGEVVLQANNAAITRLMKTAERRTLKGWPVAVANCNDIALVSDLGNALAVLPGVKAGVVPHYNFKSRKWVCSLRSVGDVDVSELAGELGGGGHKHASAFRYTGTDIEALFDDGLSQPKKSSGCSLQ